MTLNLFLIFGAAFFGFALVSKRIQGTILTPPILFTLGGLLLSRILAETAGLTYNEGGLHVLAELTLILVLAADASQISCLLYTSPSPRDATLSRMPSSA